MNTNYIVFAIPLFLVFIFIEVFLEFYTYKKGAYRLNDSIVNLGIGIGEQVISIFSRVIMLVLYDFVYHYRFFTIPSTLFTGLILLLLFDFIFYWAHRFGHEINIGWGGHIVHHSSEEYNLTVALRQPWFFSMMTFVMFLPIALLGFSPLLLVIVSGIDILYQFWIHTQFIPKLGFLEWFLNTPSHHRVHHGRNPQYIDKNYGGVFIIYDKLFGTFEEEKEEVIYGITNPVNSWNPAWANVHYYVELWKLAQNARNWKDRILIWIKPPGWKPALKGDQQAKPTANSPFHKFDFRYPLLLNGYVIVQFISLTIVSTFYLAEAGHSILGWKSLIMAFHLLYSISVLGILFENRKSAVWLDLIRLFTLPICVLLIFNSFFWPVFSVLLSILFFVWFIEINSKSNQV